MINILFQLSKVFCQRLGNSKLNYMAIGFAEEVLDD